MSGPSIRTMDFDRLATAAPQGRQDAVVRDAAGEHWEAKINPAAQQHWDAPPPPLACKPATQPELSGHRFGRFVVLRFHGATSKKNPEPAWLVRCSCGDYETRRTKTILKAADPDDCCLKCKALRTLQARARKPNTKRARRASAALLDRIAEARR